MQLLTQAKNNVSALELTRQLGVSYRTARLIKHKLLQAMALAESERQLTGRVEIDDANLGGERSGGKTGRGSENKVPFVVAVQTTEDGRAHLACLSARPFTKAALQDFIASSMGLPLTVVFDGLGCFTVAASMGAVHDREVTGGGKPSVLNEKFRAVNTLIGNFKTALTGTYHAIKFAKYGYRYLAEVQLRFNRRYDLRAMLGNLLWALAKTPGQPERGIRVAEVHRQSGERKADRVNHLQQRRPRCVPGQALVVQIRIAELLREEAERVLDLPPVLRRTGDPMKTNEESAACALSRASASALAGLTPARLCPSPVPQPRMASVPVLPGPMVNS